MNLDYETLFSLKKVHPAWRLLDADHAPLIVSFLNRVYISENVRNISQIELIAKLEDELFYLREVEGEEKYPRSASEYLEEWAQNDKGWLRKFYPVGSDEPSFDITSATEKVIGWLESLTTRKFVGTESRLMMVFELLRQMIEGTEVDPEKRIIELQKKKREIDSEIDKIRNGDVSRMSDTALRDRIQQVESTARDLLRDFREVENNFRRLDKEVRERIALWDGRKGELLEEILCERDAISSSDQGRSFQAFWDFLMSLSRQAELTEMLTKVLEFDAVKELEIDPRLKRIHYDWLEASSHTQRTVGAKRFAERYGFLAKPVQVRFRILDSAYYIRAMSDIQIPVAEFEKLHLDVDHIFITENEINGLAFPDVKRAIIIFGLGFGLDRLAGVEWLHNKRMYYWGDIDTHGFACNRRTDLKVTGGKMAEGL